MTTSGSYVPESSKDTGLSTLPVNIKKFKPKGEFRGKIQLSNLLIGNVHFLP